MSALLPALECSLSLEVAMCFLATLWYFMSELTLKNTFSLLLGSQSDPKASDTMINLLYLLENLYRDKDEALYPLHLFTHN